MQHHSRLSMLTAFRRQTIIIVLLFSCGLLSLLIMQQARTIDSQRTLIKQLFQDSLELNALKMQKVQQTLKR
jgi:hypothetical protein